MKCQEIVALLKQYKDQTIGILGLDPITEITVTSAYSFIMIEAGDVHIKFKISETFAKLETLHPANESLKNKIESASWPGLTSPNAEELPEHVDKHLTTADSVASLAVHCVRGDDYGPGNFSKVMYATTYIELQQVNYMNAKSLDHKNNYSLRSLVFRIPLNENEQMITEFNDRSSENNRHCGDKIQAALDWIPD